MAGAVEVGAELGPAVLIGLRDGGPFSSDEGVLRDALNERSAPGRDAFLKPDDNAVAALDIDAALIVGRLVRFVLVHGQRDDAHRPATSPSRFSRAHSRASGSSGASESSATAVSLRYILEVIHESGDGLALPGGGNEDH